MARFFPIALVLLACLAPVVAAQIKAKDDDPKKPRREIKPCRDEQGELLPLFKLYEVAGRKWTTKRLTNQNAPGGDRFDMYFTYEVLEVRENEALVRQGALDTAKRPTKDKPIDGTIKFDSEVSPFKPPASWTKGKDETITVPGGKFDCTIYLTGMDNGQSWISKDYPGLSVRFQDSYGSTEVFEFERFDSDKNPAKKPAKVEDPDFTLFKTRKSWLMQHTATKDGISAISYRRYEVSKADANGCELKITELNDSKKPIKDKPAEIKQIQFKPEFNDWVNPPLGVMKQRLEKRKCAAGVLACIVYKYKDDQGREVWLWFSRDLPGLTVRSRIGEDGKDGGSELVELK